MKASVSVEDAVHQSSSRSAQFRQDEAYIATAKYCDTFLRMKEDGMYWKHTVNVLKFQTLVPWKKA